MIARLLALFRLVRARRATRPAAPARRTPPAGSRRRASQAAIEFGLVAFVALNAALGVALETVKPEWRDPEFGIRLGQIRKWKTKAPDRPLVVVIGSSRAQMGLAPEAMGFPDEPGSPVVYNLGYRSAMPVVAWLHLSRLLDAGVKPDAVVVQLARAEIGLEPAEPHLRMMETRLGLADLRRLAPHVADPWVFRKTWAASRLTPWATHRTAILGDLLPTWCPLARRFAILPDTLIMDAHGYVPCLKEYPEEERARVLADVRQKVSGANHLPLSPTARQAFQDLAGRCRAEGIAVAFFWTPESPEYRSWYSPQAARNAAACEEFLTRELGVVVFPAPVHLAEDDFADGFHLLRHGATKYSRWLADNHLRPWLAK